MYLSIFSDGQALYEPLSEIILVIPQHCSQRLVQENQIFPQLGKILPADGDIPVLIYTKTVLAQIKAIVLTEIFGVRIVGGNSDTLWNYTPRPGPASLSELALAGHPLPDFR